MSGVNIRFDDALRALMDEAQNNVVMHSLGGHIGHDVSIEDTGTDQDRDIYRVVLVCVTCETDLMEASD